MVPEPADQRPAMARSSDVLPAPDGPTTSSDSPSGTCARAGARRHQHPLLHWTSSPEDRPVPSIWHVMAP